MKKGLLYILKIGISGLLALAILSCFCLIYDNDPLATEQPYGFTNYKFPANKFWVSMVEGFGYGKTNNIGYNSIDDVHFSDPVILFMGSSQTEAFQVPQKDNFVSLLQKKYSVSADNELSFVNLGISSHYLDTCASTLESVISGFENARYIVIEVGKIDFTQKQLDEMLQASAYEPYKDKGILTNAIRSIPYLRTLKNTFSKILKNKSAESQSDPIDIDYDAYSAKLDAAIARISSIAQSSGTQLIIMHHNNILFNEDGQPMGADDPVLAAQFQQSCQRYDVHYIDMTDSFITHYQDTFQLPYGFANSVMGVGHLNKTGHKLIADALYDAISTLNGDKQNGI